MRILVTGGSGLIGSYCVDAFQALGHEVIGTYSSGNSPGNSDSWIKTNLLKDLDRTTLLQTVQPDTMVHLAWDCQDWNGPEQDLWLDASRDLVAKFTEGGGRRLFTAGTSMEYAWDGQICHERDGRFESSTGYGRSKHALWTSTNESMDLLTYSHGRIFFLCGPRQGASKLVPAVVHALLNGERFLCNSGHLYRDYLDVRDVASSIVGLVEGDHSGDYNIASGCATKVEDIVRRIGELLERSDLIDFTPAPEDPPEDLTVVADNKKLSEALGNNPAFDLDKSLVDTIDWIKRVSKI